MRIIKQAVIICKLLFLLGFHYLFVRPLLMCLLIILYLCRVCPDFQDWLTEMIITGYYLDPYIQSVLEQLD